MKHCCSEPLHISGIQKQNWLRRNITQVPAVPNFLFTKQGTHTDPATPDLQDAVIKYKQAFLVALQALSYVFLKLSRQPEAVLATPCKHHPSYNKL